MAQNNNPFDHPDLKKVNPFDDQDTKVNYRFCIPQTKESMEIVNEIQRICETGRFPPKELKRLMKKYKNRLKVETTHRPPE